MAVSRAVTLMMKCSIEEDEAALLERWHPRETKMVRLKQEVPRRL